MKVTCLFSQAFRDESKQIHLTFEQNKQLSMPDETYVEQVYELVRHVPKGRVTTYGAIAATLSLGSSRMVGWALNRNFGNANVPAHRVVNRNGELTGRNHFPTPIMMQQLLEAEGVRVMNDKVQDFERLFWSPLELLEGEQ